MIEALCPDKCNVASAALHLIGDGHRGKKRLAVLVGIFCRSKDGTEVCRSVACLTFGEITIHEWNSAQEHAIVEDDTIGLDLATADQDHDGILHRGNRELVTDATDRVAI